MSLDQWRDMLCCPICQSTLTPEFQCTQCDFKAQEIHIQGRTIPDFRAQGIETKIQRQFILPTKPLNRADMVANGFQAVSETFEHLSRSEIRQRFGTKLDKGMQYYCQQLLSQRGPDVPILDLGCGNGGNRLYLQSLGFKNILTVDWESSGADLLVDAHRLPIKSGIFAMVLSTAVFEHLYNPFIAMGEVSRVLDDSGGFVGSASFWEAWHGSSYFHMTPDGWNVILAQNGMQLVDLWAGWGVVPAMFSHVITPGHLRGFGYAIQRGINFVYRLALGEQGLRKLMLRASGSYQIFAKKI